MLGFTITMSNIAQRGRYAVCVHNRHAKKQNLLYLQLLQTKTVGNGLEYVHSNVFCFTDYVTNNYTPYEGMNSTANRLRLISSKELSEKIFIYDINLQLFPFLR